MYNIFIETKIGILEITCNETDLLKIDTVNQIGVYNSNELALEVKKQLEEYFSNQRKKFDLPVNPEGSSFQKKVWKEISNVTFGETITYKELAKRVNNPKGIRAVANAVGANKILVIIPCHRIIGSNNTLTGFSSGLDSKIKLLQIENNKINEKEDLKKSILIKN